MNVGLLIGKDRSTGYPGKNLKEVLGRPLAEYGFLALANAKTIDRVFVSTDSTGIAEIGSRYGAVVIERPSELAQPSTTVEVTLQHAYEEIAARLDTEMEVIVLAFANAPTIEPGALDRGIELLQAHPEVDSVTSVSPFNMFSPARARTIRADGVIEPYVDLSTIPNVSSIRDEQPDCYFEDFAVQVLRRRCLTNMDEGELPFRWMGRRSYAMIRDYGFDIDHDWQFPVVEHWLRTHGFTERTTPYDDLHPGDRE